MSQLTRRKRRSSRRKLTVQKPCGVLHPRVEKVGPQRFGVVCFDVTVMCSTVARRSYDTPVMAGSRLTTTSSRGFCGQSQWDARIISGLST